MLYAVCIYISLLHCEGMKLMALLRALMKFAAFSVCVTVIYHLILLLVIRTA